MTLAQWAASSPVAVRQHGAAWYVPGYAYLPEPMIRQLWRLDDYLVSSVTGGSVWMVQR
jgi:hypothetical protein